MIDRTVINLFNGIDDRYRVPIYQRRYVWGETHWTHLWDDIEEKANSLPSTGELTQPAAHFTGVIVTRTNAETGEVEVVDGQQRLTTFQLILCAIRDLCKDKFPSDEKEILITIEALLKNEPHPSHLSDADKAYKFLPTVGADRDTFISLISGSPRTNNDVLIQQAYIHFKNKINDDVKTNYERMCVIAQTVCYHFKVVDIPLIEDDQAATVFESLNGRGLPLSQFDLLRNYVFLRAGKKKLDFYARYWQHFNDESFWFPIENDIMVADDFLKTFLEVKLNRKYTPRRSLFDLYQQDYLNDLRHQLGVEMDHGDNESLVSLEFEELQNYSVAYAEITTCDYNAPIYFYQYLKKHLRIPSWHPLILLLKTEVELSSEQEKIIFSILESYIVRYILCYPEMPTWMLESHFRELNLEIIDSIRESNSSFEAIGNCILEVLKRDKNTWPNDTEVTRALHELGFHWSRPLIRHILFLIEYEQMNKELTDVSLLDCSDLTIEHVMPISWEHATEETLKTWPIEAFTEGSEEYEKVASDRDLFVRSIGNLTLLTEELNKELSHKAFSDKQPLIKKYSRLSLNADVISQDNWDITQIENREKILVEKFLKIWSDVTKCRSKLNDGIRKTANSK